eukprot:6191452-Pleurochrysis_carterae.AAC.1
MMCKWGHHLTTLTIDGGDNTSLSQIDVNSANQSLGQVDEQLRMLERCKIQRGAGGPKDCKCGKGQGAANETGRTPKRSGGENRIWWRARTQGTSTPAPGTPPPLLKPPCGGTTGSHSVIALQPT